MAGLFDVPFDVHRKPGCFGNGQAEIESNGTRNTTETDE